MLTQRQAQLLNFISRETAATGVCPSYREIAMVMGMATTSNVHRLVVALEKRGYVRRLPGQARAVKVIRKRAAPNAIGPVTDDFQRGYDAGFQAGLEEGRKGK